MSKEQILKALRLCTETKPKDDCSEECPYYNVHGCIREMMNDTFEMLKQMGAHTENEE